MAKAKLDDRLAKLQNFGGSAGAEPAARALEQSVAAPPVIESAPLTPPAPVAVPSAAAVTVTAMAPAPASTPAVPKSAPVVIPQIAAPPQTIRNVAFSPHDLEQVNRLETVLLSIKNELGIRVTFADVIRLALYTAHPTKEQAMQIMLSTREQDGRLKQNKKR